MLKRAPKARAVEILSKKDRAYLKSFRENSKRHVDKVAKTQQSAMQELIDAGIYERSGKMSKRYRAGA